MFVFVLFDFFSLSQAAASHNSSQRSQQYNILWKRSTLRPSQPSESRDSMNRWCRTRVDAGLECCLISCVRLRLPIFAGPGDMFCLFVCAVLFNWLVFCLYVCYCYCCLFFHLCSLCLLLSIVLFYCSVFVAGPGDISHNIYVYIYTYIQTYIYIYIYIYEFSGAPSARAPARNNTWTEVYRRYTQTKTVKADICRALNIGLIIDDNKAICRYG